MSLVWREQLSVGNNVIDTDHRHLIDIINSVELGMASMDRQAIGAALDNLAQYSQVHFAREEKIAAAAGYSQVPNLNQSHSALMENLKQVRERIDAMGTKWSPEVVEQFTQLLRGWLIDHVIKEDLLMKPSLQKHSPSFDPR